MITTQVYLEALEAIIQKYDEPDWLAEERRAALRSFEALPAPHQPRRGLAL